MTLALDKIAHYGQGSFWLATAGEAIVPRPALEGDTACDVAIAGAGFSGLWTAYFLKSLAPALDVVLLDAAVAGYGASGRNGGWCAGEALHLEQWLADPATRESAKAMQRALFDTVRKVGEIAAREGIDCHYARDGALTVARNAAQERRLAESAGAMARAGFAADFLMLDAAETRARIAMAHARGGLFTPHCAALHPARLARGLARSVVQKGVRLYERTRVTRLERGALVTARGRVRARVTVLASEGYTPGVEGFSRRLAPLHSRMIVTAPLSAAQLEALNLRTRLCFGDARRMVTYGQRTADGRIAFGCRGDYRFASAVSDRLSRAGFEVVRRALAQMLPGLGAVEITHGWTGPLGLPRTRQPFVFHDAASGFAWAGGYLGQGVAASCLAGETLCDLILERKSPYTDLPWRAHALPRNFEPEPVRWLGIMAYRQWWTLLDRIGA